MPPEKPKHPSIECAKHGPYMVRNVETFTNSYGEAIQSRRTVALCRCARPGHRDPRARSAAGR